MTEQEAIIPTPRADATSTADEYISELIDIGRDFHRRGWVLGTSGNFSAVVSDQPFSVVITASGMDKGRLSPERFVRLDAQGRVTAGDGKPSDETKLHLTLIEQRQARAVLHTHSVWSTMLSNACAPRGGVAIEGYEMLKGLSGVRTHEHREWLPIIENSQDMTALARELAGVLDRHPEAHGFLLRGHGLYTWGRSLDEARRHVEIFEFLLEVTGRTRLAAQG